MGRHQVETEFLRQPGFLRPQERDRLALAESRPLNRGSGSIPGEPYPPFRWPYSSKSDVEMDGLKLRFKPESVNDVAGLKCHPMFPAG